MGGGLEQFAERAVAPDRGGSAFFQGSTSHQPPWQVNGVVRCADDKALRCHVRHWRAFGYPGLTRIADRSYPALEMLPGVLAELMPPKTVLPSPQLFKPFGLLSIRSLGFGVTDALLDEIRNAGYF
jgi:hypothetical protein